MHAARSAAPCTEFIYGTKIETKHCMMQKLSVSNMYTNYIIGCLPLQVHASMAFTVAVVSLRFTGAINPLRIVACLLG